DPRTGKGANTRELKRAIEAFGFKPGPVWFDVPPDNPPPELTRLLETIDAALARGVPSIVCMHYDRSPGAPEHFRLILGFGLATGDGIYHETDQDASAYKPTHT